VSLLLLRHVVSPNPLLIQLPWLPSPALASPAAPFLAGYPFDVPAGDAGLLSYAALSYHLPLIVPFSVKERIEFVWGGCMLFRTAEMRHDSRGVLRVRPWCGAAPVACASMRAAGQGSQARIAGWACPS
jgi:hypothetical protein